MLRNLLKEGGLYTVANLLTSGISLLLIPFYTAYFIPAEYGIIGMIGVFGAFFNALVSLQLNQGLSRFVGDGSTDEKTRDKFGATAIYFSILMYVICGLLVWCFDSFFVDILSSDVRIPEQVFDLAILSIVVNGIFYLQGVYFRFLRRSKTFTVLTFFHAISNILLTLWLVLGLDFGVIGIYIAANIVAPVMVVIQSYLLRHKLRPYIGREQLKALLRFSVPLIPAGISYAFLNFTDRLFINEYTDSLTQVGIYDIGVKFSSIVTLIIAGFSMAITPLIYEKHHLESTAGELARIARLFFSLGTLGVLAAGIFSLETLQLFTNESYYGAATIMPLLYISVLFTGVWMFAPGLNIRKRTGVTAIVVVISALMNIGLNFVLIPLFQLPGAALATLISIIFNNVALYIMANRYYPIRLPYLRIGVTFLLFLILLFAGGYALPWLGLTWWAAMLVKALLILLYFLILVRIGLFDRFYFQRLKSLLTK